MVKKFLFSLAALAVASTSFSAFAQSEDPDYLRSSLYTVLIKSNSQNQRLEEENNKEVDNLITSGIKSVANTDAKKAANDTLGMKLTEIPAYVFVNIPIPPQFNDHNLATRIVEYDVLRQGMTEDDINAAREKLDPSGKKGLKKKSKGGAFMKGLASSALGAASGQDNSTLLQSDEVDDYGPAVVLKFITEEQVPANMVAKWFDYAPDAETHWGMDTYDQRALESLSIKEQGMENGAQLTAAGSKASLLIPNTYLLATNLKFRSNQAVLAEAQAMANAAGSMFGGIGQLASQAAGAVAGAAAGDGYQVQAVSYLFKLIWDEEKELQIAKMLFEDNATLDQLIASGLAQLEFVGKEKAGARVRQSMLSDKPISSLVERASSRAVDASIAKLQEKHEEFRTIFPITSSNADGSINVKIGKREGVSKGDQYRILEQQEDPKTGKIVYKKIGTVKPDEKKIWNNLAGAMDEYAENQKNSDGDKDFDNDAVNLGYTTFTGGKKGQDYRGYYIQLEKKK